MMMRAWYMPSLPPSDLLSHIPPSLPHSIPSNVDVHGMLRVIFLGMLLTVFRMAVPPTVLVAPRGIHSRGTGDDSSDWAAAAVNSSQNSLVFVF